VDKRSLKFTNPFSGFIGEILGISHSDSTGADSSKRVEKLIQAESMRHVPVSGRRNSCKRRLRSIRNTDNPVQEKTVYPIRTLVSFQLFKRRENFAQHALDPPAVFELKFKLLIANALLLSSNQIKVLCMLPFGQVKVLGLLPLGQINVLRMLPVGDADGCNYCKDGANRLDPACCGRATKRRNTCDQNTRAKGRGSDRGVPDYGTGHTEANSCSHTATPSLLISQSSSLLWVGRHSDMRTQLAEITHG